MAGSVEHTVPSRVGAMAHGQQIGLEQWVSVPIWPGRPSPQHKSDPRQPVYMHDAARPKWRPNAVAGIFRHRVRRCA